MKLTKYNVNKVKNTFVVYKVPRDFADPIYNYMIYGFEPGSFFTAVLANDFARAMGSCHPANTVEAIKNTVTWICNYLPRHIAWGSPEAVNKWLKMTSDERRKILEDRRILYTEQEEIIMVLKDSPTKESFLW